MKNIIIIIAETVFISCRAKRLNHGADYGKKLYA